MISPMQWTKKELIERIEYIEQENRILWRVIQEALK